MSELLPPGTVVGRGLPVPLTSFVGRAAELADVRQLVCDNRLLTLTGAGGVGKTRLAVQLAIQLAGRFDPQVGWVDLAPIVDAGLVAVRAAHALGLPDQPGHSAADTLVRFIGDRRMLVVLDNCEHLLDGCASLVVTLLGACPGLTVVATSREPIGVPGEVIWRTSSLSLTDEAVDLFTQRAQLARPDFAVTVDNAAAIADICRRLDGLPLAIELAAARVRALSVVEILDGLQDCFRLLTGGARTAVPRQQTLRASVDWSHGLLGEPERVVFRRLAVFSGGFDLDAAEAVIGGGELPRYQVVDELARLVDKSLVFTEDSVGTTRYRLLETVRQYALDKLAASGEADTVRTRHRDHYTALFDAPRVIGLQQRIARAEAEIHNIRAAFGWSREHGDVDLAARLASSLQLLWLRGRIVEGLSWFDEILADDAATSPATRARALADKTVLDHVAGTFERADQAEDALAIARELDDPDLLARTLTACGIARLFSADVALPYFAEATELARIRGDDWQLSWILAWQADSAFMAGDPIATRLAAAEGRDRAEAIGDEVLSRTCRWFLGLGQWLSADLLGAAAQFSDVVATAQATGDAMWTVNGLFRLGRALACQGDASGAHGAVQVAVDAAAGMAAHQQALTFGALAELALADGDVSKAVAASSAAWRACPRLDLLAVNAYPMAQAALANGEVSEARRWADDAVAAARGAHRMMLLATRVRVAIAQGDLERAGLDAYDALAIAAELKAYLTIPDVLECLAGLVNDQHEAARLYGAAQAIRDRTGQIRFRVYDHAYEASTATLRKTLGDSGFDAGWAEGIAMSTDEAISFALRGRGPRKRPAIGWSSLTPAERDVVRLVSEGLTNKDVAARLFVSPRTVQTHLTHVYTKLGVSSRVQLVQEAARQPRQP